MPALPSASASQRLIGTPMLAMGDEIGRSQQGNNNAYAPRQSDQLA
jgi:pullulanase/glycogen debranching enzyme